MVKKIQLSKKRKRIAIIATTSVALIILVSVFIGIRLTVINGLDISEFGSLANLDPDNHRNYNNRAIFNIDDSHDYQHITYRVVVDGMSVNYFLSTAYVSIRITKNGNVAELEQWFFRDELLRAQMSNEVDGFYTHFEFQETFDIEAELGAYYVFQLRVYAEDGQITSFYKFFAYEEIEETETPTETPTETETGTTETAGISVITMIASMIVVASIISKRKIKMRKK